MRRNVELPMETQLLGLSGQVLRLARTVRPAMATQDDVRFPVPVWNDGGYPNGSTAGARRSRSGSVRALRETGVVRKGQTLPAKQYLRVKCSRRGQGCITQVVRPSTLADVPGNPGPGRRACPEPNQSGCNIAFQPAKNCFVDHWPIG